MTYQFVTDDSTPYLGGNIAEGDPLTYSPRVWDYLIDRFALRSVMDLGSGIGYAARYFHRHGIETIAVDGLTSNVDNAVFPTIQVDLTRTSVRCRVDLVHCQEVAEHIAPEHVGKFLASLACGRFVVMSHGTPGQAGHHHVNLQEWDYWSRHMEARGYHLLPEDTQRVRNLAKTDGAHHLARSGLVFARNYLDVSV